MKALFYVLVILRILHLHMVYLDKEEWYYTRIVTLKQGDVRGRIVRPRKNSFMKDVEVYLGIPYAAPPVTHLRFMPPGAPPSWTDTLDAFYVKPVCPQMFPNLDSGAAFPSKVSPERNIFIRRMKQYLKSESEDCLYLNIYVPHSGDKNEKEKKNHPVILFIHGESFEWNSGNLYDGSVMAGYGDVIFVTINFRLGIFGFLKQELLAGRANYGLSDQIAALRWIKGNIAEFGGDVSRITVMGHDTGAACVNFLMLSPVAEGLFHRAILMGGSALSPWALTDTPLHYIQLAEELHCSLENNTNCFQKRRKEDIISAFKKFEELPFESTFTPVVDDVVVLNSPAEHMEKYSLFSKYDLLAGVNEVESYYLLREEEFLKFGMLTAEGNRYLETYIKAIFKKIPNVALSKTIEKYLRHLRGTSPIQTRNVILDVLSDMLVTAPVLQTLHYHAHTLPNNTFFYVFGHHTLSEIHLKINRSVYGDDLPYALGVPLNGPSFHYNSVYTTGEEQLSETILRYFSNFAKTGDPNSPNNLQFLSFGPYTDSRPYNARWPPFRVGKQPFMYFGDPPQVRFRYREEYDYFWNHILPTSIKNYEGFSTDISNRKPPGTGDTIENDDSNNAPTHVLPPFVPDFTYNPYNNFYNLPNANGGDPLVKANSEEISTADTSSMTVFILIIVVAIFLLVNVVAFVVIFYQRGKLRVRDKLFRNRFRCKTVSVPDIFDQNEHGGDIYAIAAANKEVEDSLTSKVTRGWKQRILRKLRRESDKNIGNELAADYDTIRVASIKPEAICGKRMKRWPLSRQYSGSTITVDPHSKVRNWMHQEIANKKKFFVSSESKKKGASICDRKYKHKMEARKVSIAVDATPAARTQSVLKQIPIEFTKSLDDMKHPSFTTPMKPCSSMNCVRKLPLQRSNALSSEDSEEYYQRTGTHKSSAHIRLRTPEFLLDALTPGIHHAHTHSAPSPTERQDLAPLYSHINKEAKCLKTFTDSIKSSCNSKSSQYDQVGNALTSVVKKNYPKVLPDLPGRKHTNRLSLPPSSSVFQLHRPRIPRVPPVPPPRQVATLGRKLPSAQSPESSPEQQCSQLTVQLRKINATESSDGKLADIIQTECSTIDSDRIQLEILNSIEEARSDHIPEEETSSGSEQ